MVKFKTTAILDDHDLVVTVHGESNVHVWYFDPSEPVTAEDVAAAKAAKKWFDKRRKGAS